MFSSDINWVRSVHSSWLTSSHDCQGLENAQPRGVTQQGQWCIWGFLLLPRDERAKMLWAGGKLSCLSDRWHAKPVTSLFSPGDEKLSQEGDESCSITQCWRQSLAGSQLLLLQGMSSTLSTGGGRGVSLHWCAAVCQGLHYSSQGLVLSKSKVPDLS